MAAIRDRTKARSHEYPEEGEPISMAQQHLQELLRKQLSTRKVSVQSTIEQAREFAPAVVFEPLARAVEGLHSLEQYQVKEGEHSRLDDLRELGLTTQEIELKLSSDEKEFLGPGSTKKKKLSVDLPAKGKMSVEPSAQQERMRALNEKISSREELLKRPLKFAGVHHMSRHAMEVENSLFRHQGNPLTHLTVEDPRNHISYPSRVIPGTISQSVPSSSAPKSTSSDDGDGSEGCRGPSGGQEKVTPLPIQVIERNRLSDNEIAALPRFSGYSPGEPSKVLYLKNLHSSVTGADLEAVFGALESLAKQSQGPWEPPQIRLMTGRLRGQAFVKFTSVEGAMIGMKKVHGFMMKGKPVIISYGQKC